MIKLKIKQKITIFIIIASMITLIGYYVFSKINFNTDELEIEYNNEIAGNINEENMNNGEPDNDIIIHITGEIEKEGIVKIKEGARLIDVIEAAGGLTENAYTKEVNFAYVVEDGQKIYIPSIEDKDNIEELEYIQDGNGENIIANSDSKNKSENKIMVNINKATQTELEELQGIGPSTALKIIEYREENGRFNSIDEIKNVPRNRRIEI